jgi:hypothetical protein
MRANNALIWIALAVGLVWAAPALSGTSPINVKAFKTMQRSMALFDHDAHNEKAKLDNCGDCHHGGKDGKIDKTATTEGQPCADCHTESGGKGVTSLKNAYHRQCVACHEAKSKGPLVCGECHRP